MLTAYGIKEYILLMHRRLTAIGYEASIYEIYSMDTSTNTVLQMISEVVLQVVCRVEFFSLKPVDIETPSDFLQEGMNLKILLLVRVCLEFEARALLSTS